jgi:CRISPR/Cas system-associated exonuclease Cas4 (RecB family)
MDSFLKQVTSGLIQKYSDNLFKATIVFPNRRAGIVFSNYLNSLVTKPMIAPEIITISELFATFSVLHVPDKLSLVFRLFKVYKDLKGSTEQFDEFYYWGGMLISDFDQIDKYMLNARELFTNITELKEIDSRFADLQIENKQLLENFWGTLTNENKSPNQQEFIRLWKDLAGIYENFKAVLHSEGIAYEGMLYRDAVESLFNKRSELKDKQYAFVGFNALNKCEEALFEYMDKTGKASFFWDYDNYYLLDNEHEAGLFLRKNLKKFPQEKFPHRTDLIASEAKTMRVVNIASNTGQAQIAGDELSRLHNLNRNFKFDDTVIVLCDEELLLPVISALPAQIDKVNITMGFPMNLTPVFSLINQLTELQKNCRNNSGELSFYYKNVSAILNHQLVIAFKPEHRKELSDYIVVNNVIYLSTKQLAKNDLYRIIFSFPQKVPEYLEYFLNILKMIFLFWEKNESGENSVVFREYIFRSYLAINNLKEIIMNSGPKIIGHQNFMSLNTFFRILLQYLGELTIPFEGEPLEGLQIMGILETRVLDFRNIIFLSMNDGVMPKISVSGSFIPYNLRRAFGLPTIEEQNAIYAYYFYRLLQRADDVTFVYNSGSDGLITGEKSRYLYQLQMESPFKISESTATYKMTSIITQPIKINKDDRVINLLNNYIDGGSSLLSPTALDKYLTCSLQFYFRHVAGLKESEEVSEEIDPRIFGKLFHSSMENLYSPMVGKRMENETFVTILKDHELIERAIFDAFRKEYFKGTREDEKFELLGKNWLIFEIVRKYVLQILSLDQKRAPFRIEGLERKVDVKVPIRGLSRKVLIGGTIDRIDRFDDYLQILDYKTGNADPSYSMLNDLFEYENKSRNKAAFQTLVYSYILFKSNPAEESIRPGIYNLRDIFRDDYDASLKCKEIGNQPVDFVLMVTQFEGLFTKLLEDIFDQNIPFEQTTIEENCAYCPYKYICRR